MCRTFLIYSKNKDLAQKLCLALSIKAYDNNRDGFFVRTPKDFIRTLNFNEYVDFVKNNKSELYHAHLRLRSSGEVSIINVHGWVFEFLHNNWYCTENGSCIMPYDKVKCDTLLFFESITRKRKKKNKIEYIKSRFENDGSGVFICTDIDFKRFILATPSDIAYLYEIKHKNNENDVAYIVSSKEDIVENSVGKTVYNYDYETKITRKKIWFYEKTVTSYAKVIKDLIDLTNYEITERESIRNKFMIVNLKDQEIEYEDRLKPHTTTYDYKDVYYDKWGNEYRL